MRRLVAVVIAVLAAPGVARAGNCPCWSGEQLRAVAVAPGGAFVAAGPSAHALVLARYLPGGKPDPGFGKGGEVVVPALAASTTGKTFVAVRSDGRIVVLVEVQGEGAILVRLARFLADGTLDPSFGDRGQVALSGNRATGLGVLPDGRIVVGTGNAVLRLDADGGSVATTGGLSILAIAVASDASVAVVELDGGTGLKLVRLAPDGARDAAFGNGGAVALPAWDSSLGPWARVAFDQAGHIVVAVPRHHGLVVLRFMADGAADTGFGVGGGVERPSETAATSILGAGGLAVAPDGAVLVVVDERLWRVSADGRPDRSFGAAGLVTAVPSAAWAVAVAADGSPAVVGSTDRLGGQRVLLRYDLHGAPDREVLASWRYDLFAVGPTGGPRRLTRKALFSGPLASSRDGRRIAFVSDRSGAPELYVSDPAGTHVVSVTHAPIGGALVSSEDPVVLSPKGGRVAFATDDQRHWVIGLDGTGLHQVAVGPGTWSWSWSPDGRRLVYQKYSAVFVVDVAGGRPRALGPGANPAWSPRGGLIAVRRSGRVELVRTGGHRVRRLPGRDADNPVWSPDGRELAISITVRSSGWVEVVRADGHVVTRLPCSGSASWSPDGRLACNGRSALVIVTRGGKQRLVRTRSLDVESTPAWVGNRRFVFIGYAPL